MLSDYAQYYININNIWQMFSSSAAQYYEKTISSSKYTFSSIHYLCERHVRGNCCSLFRQKPLLLLSEHNLFELELEGEETQIFNHLLHLWLFREKQDGTTVAACNMQT